MPKGSIDLKNIWKTKALLTFCHAFTGCDTVSSIVGHEKSALVLFRGYWQAHRYLLWLTGYQGDTVIRNGIANFKHTYNVPGTTLKEIWCSIGSSWLIKPETLSQQREQLHSIQCIAIFKPGTGCLSKALLWTLDGPKGLMPVSTLDPIATEELLQFTSFNCHRDCTTKQCSCKKISVHAVH